MICAHEVRSWFAVLRTDKSEPNSRISDSEGLGKLGMRRNSPKCYLLRHASQLSKHEMEPITLPRLSNFPLAGLYCTVQGAHRYCPFICTLEYRRDRGGFDKTRTAYHSIQANTIKY